MAGLRRALPAWSCLVLPLVQTRPGTSKSRACAAAAAILAGVLSQIVMRGMGLVRTALLLNYSGIDITGME